MGQQKHNWQEIINLWNRSGLTQAEFCREKNINQNLFSKWKVKLGDGKIADDDKTDPFIEIKIPDSITDYGIDLRVGSYSINLKPDFNKQLLKDVLQVIGEIQ
jgi:hypothetical protein